MVDDPDKPETEIFFPPAVVIDSFNPIRDGWDRYKCRKSVNSNLCFTVDGAKLQILEIVPNPETRCLPFLYFVTDYLKGFLTEKSWR